MKNIGFIVQNVHDLNILEDKLFKLGFSYKRYENDFNMHNLHDVYTRSGRMIKAYKHAYYTEELNVSETRGIIIGWKDDIKIPYLNHIEVIPGSPILKSVPNNKFLLMLFYINRNNKTIDFVDFEYYTQYKDIKEQYTITNILDYENTN